MRLRRSIAFVLAAAMVVAACGGDDSGSKPVDTTPSDITPDQTTPDRTTPDDTAPDQTMPDQTMPDDTTPDAPASQLVRLPERAAPAAPATVAGSAVTAFGFDIFAAAEDGASATDNLVISPLSIAIALGMMEPGANDQALAQLHELLRIDDPAIWHASMNALEQDLEARVAELPDPGAGDEQDPGEFVARIANAAFLQPEYPFLDSYLDTIGTNYGAVLEELDFADDQEAAAARINEFIADATDDHITDLVRADDIDPATVLALVNALLLRASWESVFDAEATVDDEFTRSDGSTVTVPMMLGRGDRSGRGDGWVAASKSLVGGVRLDVVLPDDGRFDEVTARLGDVFDEYDAGPLPGGALGVPKFETRVNVALTEALMAAGLTAPFGEGQLMGIADDPQLVLDKALHQTWLSVDETGIEAAAATVLLMMVTSAPIDQPVDVILDRPFVVRIVDTTSGATLFLGRIMDPTA